MNFAGVCKQARRLVHVPLCQYHIDDLMRRAVHQRKPLIYGPAVHLYIDNIAKMPFNERKFVRILLELQKIDNEKENYLKLLNIAAKNQALIQDYKSISMIFLVAFEIRFEDKEAMKTLGLRGFEILKTLQQNREEKSYSYAVCKNMIALQRLIGLQQFTDEHFNLILVDRLKPLFLTYILQLFWESNLQDKFQFPKKLVNVLSQHRELIPFSDVHHMLLAKKIIKDQTFSDITIYLQSKLQQRVTRDKNTGQQQKIDPQVVSALYEEYINDLKARYL